MGGIAALTKVLTKSSSKKSTRKGLTAAEKKKLTTKQLKTEPLTEKELVSKGMVQGDTKGADAAAQMRIQMSSLKGKAKGLANTFKAKEKLYDKLSASDKKGEKGQLLQNALKDIKKKLKGQVPIRTLESAKLLNKGGLSTKDYGKAGGYNMGGLATPTPKQTGLKKLPTGVRNKMGYMYGGGMANKKMGSTDYRKGGLVIMITGGKPMKNKKGTK